MKKIITSWALLFLFINLSAQISIPQVSSSSVIVCGTNNYSITGTPGTGGNDIEWYSDYLTTTSLGTGTTYNGATTSSTMLYAKSKNGLAYSNDPAQIFIFKPQVPTATSTQTTSCSNGVSISIQVDTIIDSLTTIVLEDATIDPSNPNTNYNNTFLVIRPQGFCGGNVHFLSKYDLSILPPSVSPFYSKSSVVAYSGFAHGGNGSVYEQHVLNDAWNETTVTNATAPMPLVPNSNAAGNHSGNWWVWYGFPSMGVAHGGSATMGTSAEGDKPLSNTNILLNQLVSSEYLGDQTMSLYHFSLGYDSRYYAKEHKTNESLLPQLQVKFSYNQANTCTYSWSGPGGFTANTKDIQNLTQNGTYTLTITSAYGCTSTVNVNVTTAGAGAPVITNTGNLSGCDSIQLPAITGTNLTTNVAYFTGINGTGTTYAPSDWISSSMTMYIYDQVSVNCVDEETFTITISDSPDLTTTNLSTCGTAGVNITNSYTDNNNTGGTVTYWQDALATIPELNPTNITTAGTYYIVMDAGGCTDTAGVTISFSVLQPINFGPDTLLCHNQSLTLDAGVGFTHYLWNDASTNQTLTTNMAGTYWVQGSVTGTNTIINGDFENGSSGFTTDYVVGTGGTWGPISNPGTYLVTNNANTAHTNFLNCTDHTTGTGNMIVVNGSSIANQNVWCQTVAISPNTDYEFSTWVQNYDLTNPAQLAFFINGTQIGATFTPTTAGCTWENFFQLWNSGTATSANVCITNQSIANSGNDFALDDVSFSPLCVSSDTIVVTIDSGPTTTVPADSTFCASDAIPASAFTSSPAGGTFNWLNSNPAVGLTAISGSGNIISFTATNATLLPDTSTVSVWSELNNCSGDTSEYLIITLPLPAAPTALNKLICVNNSATLTATAPGGIYEWFDAASGGNLVHTGPSYTTPTLSVDTTFWVQSTINGCTGARTQVNITIGNGLVVDAGLDTSICNGQSVTLSTTPNNPTYTYNWSEPGVATIDTFANQTVSPLDTTMFTVMVTDTFGCIGMDSVTVNVKPTPVVTIPIDSIYCNGETVPPSAFTSIPTGATYTWTNSDTAVGLAQTNGANNTPSFTAANSTTQQIFSTISVTPTLLSCVGNPVNYSVTVNPIPTLANQPDLTYCLGDIVPPSQIAGTPVGVTFNWTNSNPNIGLGLNGLQDVPSFTAANNSFVPISGNITVTPKANGCFGPAINYIITITPSITLDRIIYNATCFGDSDGEISIIPSGGTPSYSYNWSNGSSDSTAINLPSDSITVIVTDMNNCTQDSTFYISQPDSIDYITFIASPTQGCSPLDVRFNSTINPVDHLIQNYVWDFGNNLVPQDSFIAHSTYITPGTYDVSLTVTDYNGCSNTLSKTNFIEVYEDPEANFEFTPEAPKMLNPTVEFRDLSYDNVVAWEWYFAALDSSDLQHPTYMFPGDSGSYMVTLIVENNNNCKDTITKVVEIKSEIALFFPNSFTPNGDGINDIFMPKGFGVDLQSYSFKIFNRWGELVFETNNIANGWDGTYNGETLPSGVYPWRIDYKDLNGNEFRKKGNVNVLK